VGLFHVWLAILHRVAGHFLFVQEILIPKPNNTRRKTGYFVHVAPSKSGKFWAIAKSDESGEPYFCYGRNFLNCPDGPKVGWNCEFSPLPPGCGPLARATEIRILPATKHEARDQIIVEHLADGRAQLVLRDNTGERVLSELTYQV
jgi:hypothetical protein